MVFCSNGAFEYIVTWKWWSGCVRPNP